MNESNLEQINSDLRKTISEKDQYYFGHGKLLLTGEYFVLDGALSLALPTKVGQSLSVKYTPSFSPVLTWKSYDVDNNLWFESKYEFWHFKCLDENPTEDALVLQKILQQVRKENPHFLRDDVDVLVETRLGFPLTWGLGSSSSLIYNIAQWAYISPFELLFKTMGGSGYDIACAQSDGPILYKKNTSGPNWSPVSFYPSFSSNLYFVYLGQKMNSRDAIKDYSKKKPFSSKVISTMTEFTNSILNSKSLQEFMELILKHEEFVGETLGMIPIKKERFSDFNGAMKSLGAWGGDFALVATPMNFDDVKKYFNEHGLSVCYKFSDLISIPIQNISDDSMKIDVSSHLVH